MTTALERPPEEAAEDTSFARGLRLVLTVADRGEMRADELSSVSTTRQKSRFIGASAGLCGR